MQQSKMRSESYAYSSVNSPQNIISRLDLFCRTNSKSVLACIGFVIFVFLISSETVQRPNIRSRAGQKGSHWGGASHPGYFKPQPSSGDTDEFSFAMVTDLDQLSRDPDSSKPLFYSKLLPGTLRYAPSANSYSVRFHTDDMRVLRSAHNEAGRGMELSEMTLYRDRLLTFDDRTGCVFEILSDPASGGKDSLVVPRFVITEGEGDTDKGMKWEWATVKDDKLHIGSMGKEYTRPDGTIQNTNNLWIVTIDADGHLTRIDWTEHYNFVRNALGAKAPGYVMHEAVLWSHHLAKWIFIPRRISKEAYDEYVDENKGSNKIVLIDENFTTAEVVDIKFEKFLTDGLHGFSTFAFVPNTNDRHALAIRSVEEDCVGGKDDVCKQRSYVTVFDVLTGDVLMDEVDVDLNVKFEGVEFVDINTPSPIIQ